MSNILTFQHLVSTLMESEIDSARQKALETGQLDESILIGMKIYRAQEDDPPHILEGQLGVVLNTDDNNQCILIIHDNHGPTAIIADRYAWQSTSLRFSDWDDIDYKPKLSTGRTLPSAADLDKMDADFTAGDKSLERTVDGLMGELNQEDENVNVDNQYLVYANFAEDTMIRWVIVDRSLNQYVIISTNDEEEITDRSDPIDGDPHKVSAILLRNKYSLVPPQDWPDFL